MIRLLATNETLTIVVGTTTFSRSLATRIAHDVYVYHRLDSQILESHEALERTARGLLGGNMLVIGRPEENRYVEGMIAQKQIPRRSLQAADGSGRSMLRQQYRSPREG
jgi:hypothetical protein